MLGARSHVRNECRVNNNVLSLCWVNNTLWNSKESFAMYNVDNSSTYGVPQTLKRH